MDRFHLEAGSVSLRTLLEFTAAARRIGAEIEVDRWLIRPYVSGVEVTQGIQYFGAERHLTNGDDRGPDNSVRLIARKPAWVRVYVRSGLFGADQVLTGDLIVEHRTGPFLGEWTPVATLLPLAPGAVTSQRDPVYTTERGTIGSSINFAVGAALMEGMVRFTARIWSAGDATRTPIDTWQQTVDATLLQTLSLRGVFVHYNGPDPTINATNPPTVDLPAPGLANLQATAAWTLKTNPIEATGVFSSAGQMNWFAPSRAPPPPRAAAHRDGSRSRTSCRSSRTMTATGATSSTTGSYRRTCRWAPSPAASCTVSAPAGTRTRWRWPTRSGTAPSSSTRRAGCRASSS